MSELNKWLETLKEGDRVFIGGHYFSNEYYIPDKVKRITKTMITLENTKSRFRRNGEEMGVSRWSDRNRLIQDNEQTRERIWILNAQNKLSSLVHSLGERRIDYNTLTLEQLERLIPELTKIRDELIPQKKEEVKKE